MKAAGSTRSTGLRPLRGQPCPRPGTSGAAAARAGPRATDRVETARDRFARAILLSPMATPNRTALLAHDELTSPPPHSARPNPAPYPEFSPPTQTHPHTQTN